VFENGLHPFRKENNLAKYISWGKERMDGWDGMGWDGMGWDLNTMAIQGQYDGNTRSQYDGNTQLQYDGGTTAKENHVMVF